jgi:hypothetical protein
LDRQRVNGKLHVLSNLPVEKKRSVNHLLRRYVDQKSKGKIHPLPDMTAIPWLILEGKIKKKKA